MRKLELLGVVLTSVSIVGAAQAGLITPVRATTTTGAQDVGAVAANLINHNGLAADGTHASAFDTQNHWRVSNVPPAAVTFDLGGRFVLNSASIWNYNESGTGGGGAANTNRGGQSVTFTYSDDNVTFSNAKTVTLSQATGTNTYAGETRALDGVAARYVRATINTSYGSNNGYTGLSEVRFDVGNARITPVGVTANQTQNGGGDANNNFFQPVNLTNGSNMGGYDGNLQAQAAAGNGFTGLWRQRIASGNTVANSRVTFDLGTDQNVGLLEVWNYNEADQVGRGIQTFNLLQSDDNVNFAPVGSTLTLTQSPNAASTTHDVFDLASFGVNARYLRMDLINNYGAADYYGLGEVRFYAPVPEPSTAAAALAGAALLAFRRRRRRA